ncbi:twin-arginine translocation signal domain-containing protein [Halobacteria archaeon AArc-curdl1]|uniref:Twin-arginine translocation signal domain-containing protein n=1 Tax=Natronosalvus hydrolyticus TaxID=2979988 RepID=A0AAP2Z7I6_9EURY|nr:twin-arginine translocation signal domain-containing protein [Halobacteria archaeon AArc-curdl1]
MDTRELTPSRRQFLGGLAGAGAVATAGCLGGIIGSSSGKSFAPSRPSDPPEGTPSEFYYVLEEGLRDYEITVEAMYENDGDLILEYESTVDPAVVGETADDSDGETDSETESDDADSENEPADVGTDPLEQATMDELGVIVQAYNEIVVQNGGGTEYEMLIGDIANPLEGQAYGWGVRQEWLEAYNDGDLQQFALWMQISQLIVYEEDIDDVS